MGIPYAEVIGDPIDHSKSPLIHKFWLEKLGIEGDYRAVHVTPEELPYYLARRRGDPDWRGCNVAMPHKVRVWRLLGYAAEFGRDGIVNCVARDVAGIEGHNFDTDALMRTLPIPVSQGSVVIIGSGGAARAAIEARPDESVILIARSEERALALLQDAEYGRWYPFEKASKALKRAVGVINATPLGMGHADPMPANVIEALAGLTPGGYAYEMVYEPVETDFLVRARELDLVTIDGLTMLVEQAALSFKRFFNQSPPRKHNAELRELLTR